MSADDEKRERMNLAFQLVDPVETFRFFHGSVAAEKAAPYLSWRDKIHACVPDSRLKHYGVTIEEVCDAILFFTATSAMIKRVPFGKLGTRDYQGEMGYLVEAMGYREGPAGP